MRPFLAGRDQGTGESILCDSFDDVVYQEDEKECVLPELCVQNSDIESSSSSTQ